MKGVVIVLKANALNWAVSLRRSPSCAIFQPKSNYQLPMSRQWLVVKAFQTKYLLEMLALI